MFAKSKYTALCLLNTSPLCLLNTFAKSLAMFAKLSAMLDLQANRLLNHPSLHSSLC